VRTHNYALVGSVVVPAGVSQPGGSGCSAASSAITYDANGNLASRTDFDGHRTCYANDVARNLETKRVEALVAGAASAASLATPPAPTIANPVRTVSTQWHPDWRLEVKRAEAKKVTSWVYNGQPDPTAGNAIAGCAPSTALLPDGKPIAVLCKKIEQATTDATGASGFSATLTGNPRVSTWTYNAFGQVLTANGPRTDVSDLTTYAYYSDTTADHTLGDLWKVTNPAGHVTEYTRYDRNGRLLEMTDPNGLVTTQTHTPRGWLKTRQVGTELTTYDYDAVGQLKKVTLPDGSWLGNDYDGAHRLIATYDHQGNRVTYTLDNAGNRTKEEVKDPGGALVRTQTRVYDALSRLQNIVQPQ
jgi:YD repeat-containing protein